MNKWILIIIGSTLSILLFNGCMSPERAQQEADETALGLTESAYRHVRMRERNAFTLTYAHPNEMTGDILLNIHDAQRVGAKYDRQYQSLKESIYIRALALDSQVHAFETTLNGFLSGDVVDVWDQRRAAAQTGAGVKRKFQNGSTLVGKLALNVSNLLKSDQRSVGLVGDMTLTVPLLRGSDRDVVREPLLQAERDLIDAIRTLERYRETFSYAIINTYLTVVADAQRLINTEANYTRLKANQDRAKSLFEAGRMGRVEYDQANQDYLSANESVVVTRRNYEANLDGFKLKLGLPPHLNITLDNTVLTQLQAHFASRLEAPETVLENEESLYKQALQNRYDYLMIVGEEQDALRKINVAEDALGADLSISFSGHEVAHLAGADQVDQDHWDAAAKLDAPWEREAERNAYRIAYISYDRAKRNTTQKADQIRDDLRNDIRTILAARTSFDIQSKAMDLARRRVESNALFMKAGRSQMRDVLEAESAYLQAQNAFVSATILWHTRDLKLKLDLGDLPLTKEGILIDKESNS